MGEPCRTWAARLSLRSTRCTWNSPVSCTLNALLVVMTLPRRRQLRDLSRLKSISSPVGLACRCVSGGKVHIAWSRAGRLSCTWPRCGTQLSGCQHGRLLAAHVPLGARDDAGTSHDHRGSCWVLGSRPDSSAPRRTSTGNTTKVVDSNCRLAPLVAVTASTKSHDIGVSHDEILPLSPNRYS